MAGLDQPTTIEEEIFVGVVREGQGDGVPLILLGLPTGIEEYTRDGKTHTFDLTKVGLNAKLLLFGGPTHDSIMGMLDQVAPPAAE